MKQVKKVLAVAIGAVVLTGCGSTAYKEQKDHTETVSSEIEYLANLNSDLYIDMPPVDLTPKPLNKPKTWADHVAVDINSASTGLDGVLQDLSRRLGVAVYYGKETNKNIPVKLKVQNGSLSDLARAIESQTDYKVDLSDDYTISVLAWETDTFQIKNLVGRHRFMIGKDSSADIDEGVDSDVDTSSGALFNADQNQYANIQSEDTSEITEMIATIEAILGKEVDEGASVSGSKASGAITVTARARTMRDVRKYVKSMNDEFGKQVMVKVRVLTFESTKNNSFGIDWNLLRTTTSGVLNFASSSSGGVVNSLDDIGSLGYSVASGSKLDGSTVFINALKEQGNVAIVTEPTMLVTNNRMGEIERLRKEGYVKNVSIPTVTSDSSSEYAEVTQGVVSEGFTMRLLPKIVGDEVLMQFSTTVSKLGRFGEVDLPNVSIKTPNMSEERFNQPITAKDGMTIVLSGYNQGTTSYGEKKSFENEALGGNHGSDVASQTIVLLTPTIIK